MSYTVRTRDRREYRWNRRHLLTTRSLSAKNVNSLFGKYWRDRIRTEPKPHSLPTDPGFLQWPVPHLILSSCEATCETWFMNQLRKTLPKTSSCVDFLFRSFSKKGDVSIARCLAFLTFTLFRQPAPLSSVVRIDIYLSIVVIRDEIMHCCCCCCCVSVPAFYNYVCLVLGLRDRTAILNVVSYIHITE